MPASDRPSGLNGARPAVIVVVMGVTGVGKTTIGRLVAQDLGWGFLDADDYHPPANVAKMRSGVPLTDADREPWLAALRAEIDARLARSESAVLACSALKRSYRDRLHASEAVRFVHLRGDATLIRERLLARSGHYMDPGLLASQFAALEAPQGALVIDVAAPPMEIASRIEAALGFRRSAGGADLKT
jgi:gluconokinase